MLANNHGHIVSINSMLGLMGAGSVAEYCASKFGALGLHEALCVEVARAGKSGVFLTTVHPYQIDTDMFAGVTTRSGHYLCILMMMMMMTGTLRRSSVRADPDDFLNLL